MKITNVLLILLAFILLSSKAHADSGFIRFTLDKAIYEKLSHDQKGSLAQKIQELHLFVEKDLKSKIPANIQDRLSGLKLKISFTDTPGRDGLFVPNEEAVNGQEEHTISVQLNQINSSGIKSLIAHEIYHAIHYHLNPDELPWIREGMAQLFEFITTNKLNGINLLAAINEPMTPLLGEYDPEKSNRAQYGHNMLYFYYLYNQCGGNELFWKITTGVDEKIKGSFLIDSVLKSISTKNSECANFPISAVTFEVAKLHNQVQFLNPKEKNKYLVIPMEIHPKMTQAKTSKELETIIQAMPTLSSYRIPLKDFLSLKGKCPNCETYYVTKEFPYSVSNKPPGQPQGVDVVLVKLRAN